MSKKIDLDRIVRKNAEQASLQTDWDRQRKSARLIGNHFDQGYETVLLADEVGMGKTYVALSAMAVHLMQEKRNHRKVLLVTPPSAVLRHKWVQEINSFSSKYLVDEKASGGFTSKGLRPHTLGSYWDLFQNLHDFDNGDVQRVSSEKQSAFVSALYKWACAHKHIASRTVWKDMQIADEYERGYQKFRESFSIPALWSYLDGEYALRPDEFKKLFANLKDPKEPHFYLNALLKDFARRQDSFEPNVLIISMPALAPSAPKSAQNRLFFMYLFAHLMSRRSEDEKSRMGKTLAAENLLPDQFQEPWSKRHLAVIAGWREVDLYGLRRSMHSVLDEPANQAAWIAVRSALIDKDASGASRFFTSVRDQIFQHKLKESGIDLAVVDEVHNWKSGAYNAKVFARLYQPSIRHKLIMSATPFQIEEGELKQVFGYVSAHSETSRTWALVEELFGEGETLVRSCLKASRAFDQAWRNLSGQENSARLQELLMATDAAEIRRLAKSMWEDGSLSGQVTEFAAQLIAYRAQVSMLENRLSGLILRHTKPRQKRHFCIGSQFDERLAGRGPAQRFGLYPSQGYHGGDSAFVTFVGMRLGQLAMRKKSSSMEARARLLSGMTSSIGAYRQSSLNAALAGDAEAGTDDREAAAYAGMFNEILDAAGHPKVAATVAVALENFRRGDKTLIFCERLATLQEIKDLLDAQIDAMSTVPRAQAEAERSNLLARPGFVDNLWAVSLVHAGAIRQNFLDSHLDTGILQVTQWLTRLKLKPSLRRVSRLVDIHVIAEAVKAGLLDQSGWQKAAQFFATLAGVLNDDDTASALVPSYITGKVRPDALKIDDDVPGHEDDELEEVKSAVHRLYRQQRNFWCGRQHGGLQRAFWTLLETEASCLRQIESREISDEVKSIPPLESFFAIVEDLVVGSRKIALRADLVQRYKAYSTVPGSDDRLIDGFENMPVGDGETMLSRLAGFILKLADEDGSINQAEKRDSRRRSMWRGVYMPNATNVMRLDGSVDAERRVAQCAAFNSPLLPYVMVCSSIGSEGIDLHRFCAEIILHDLPWNPARLEQRIGRLDRVNSMARPTEGAPLHVRIPFLANDYEKYQYDQVFARAQKFEVLLGQPDFALVIDEETYGDGEDQTSVVKDDAAKDESVPFTGERLIPLPPSMVDFLKIDLGVDAAARLPEAG